LDEETVAQIQENLYLQYFVGLQGYQMEAPFAPSLLVEIRKRMGQDVFEVFHKAIIGSLESSQQKRKASSQANKTKKDRDELKRLKAQNRT
jgi:hypothetical protein